jgi:hypothetical protein
MADPVTVHCNVSPCVVVHQIELPPFQLEAAEGAQIASAILAVWAVGYGIRMLIRALNSDGKPTDESDWKMKSLPMKNLVLVMAVALATTGAQAAAIDVTAVVTEIAAQAAPIGLIGAAVLMIVVAVKAFKWVRAALSWSIDSAVARGRLGTSGIKGMDTWEFS